MFIFALSISYLSKKMEDLAQSVEAGSKLSVQKLEAAAKILKTVSHPVRLEILKLLETEAPLDVTTICERLTCGCEQSMMSHHLNKMKDNGLLRSRKEGKQVFYEINNRRILKIFNCIEGCEDL